MTEPAALPEQAFDPQSPATRSAAAERSRRHRQRERDGVRVFRVGVDHYGTVDRLIALGRLSEEAAADDAATARALEQWIADNLPAKKA